MHEQHGGTDAPVRKYDWAWVIVLVVMTSVTVAVCVVLLLDMVDGAH